ncbi:hypothetical protein BHE74_00033787 [Ensete ventricosum]|uniref:Uncharacterized protein n=1 Tax=Ensete ventricosum TaxID=4639 RepID=A0A426Y1P8_ENSVE|nr:hypothetical protein B296_00054936 [Ensete ventricosum]RWW59289.1 hypothetical protein BHE74_00033787 [Ensete ventricosum]RZS01367.1 hypothetical protein BHM03_00031211 [Ensete ventricosum]
MSDYGFMSDDGNRYIRLPSEPAITERQWIFDELPTAKIVAASRPDAGDITPLLLSYTIEFQYKQVFTDLVFRLIFLFYLCGMSCPWECELLLTQLQMGIPPMMF